MEFEICNISRRFFFRQTRKFTFILTFLHGNFISVGFNETKTMKRDTTILVLCALFLLADALCFDETIRFRQSLEKSSFLLLLLCQMISALLIFSLAYFVAKRKLAKRFTPNFAVFQSLRRVLLSVWTLKFVRR